MTLEPRDADPRVDALLAAWSRATARAAPGFSIPARSQRLTPLRIAAVVLAIVLALAALAAAGSFKIADDFFPAVAACADGDWPATQVSCEAAERSFQAGTSRIDRRRVWLTTLDDIRHVIRLEPQVDSYPTDAAPVWVFIYDGSRSGVSYQGANGQPAWTGSATRWIHVADAAQPATVAGRYLYDYGWDRLGKPPMPEALPRPHLPALAKVEPGPPSDVAATAIRSLATARAVSFELTVGAHYGDLEIIALHSTGTVDFDRGRLAADADGGGREWSMLFFGGPTSGSAVIADGLFIHDQTGVWERIPDGRVPTDRLFDATARSTGLADALAKATIGSSTRVAPCGTIACQVVEVKLPPSAMAGLLADMSGATPDPLPADVGDVTGELFVDPGTGFPRRVDGTFSAGDTTWLVTLSLEPLDQAPAITPPIP